MNFKPPVPSHCQEMIENAYQLPLGWSLWCVAYGLVNWYMYLAMLPQSDGCELYCRIGTWARKLNQLICSLYAFPCALDHKNESYIYISWKQFSTYMITNHLLNNMTYRITCISPHEVMLTATDRASPLDMCSSVTWTGALVYLWNEVFPHHNSEHNCSCRVTTHRATEIHLKMPYFETESLEDQQEVGNNKRDGVSNHRLLDCLLKRLFRQIKKNTKAPRHCLLWRESTSDRWIPLTKGQ